MTERIINRDITIIHYFGASFSFGAMAHDKVMASMTLFAEQVMPAFR